MHMCVGVSCVSQQFCCEPFGIPSAGSHTAKFAPFILMQALTLRPEFSQAREIPYDLYYPSVKEDIIKRTCSYCGLYFSSKLTVDSHRYHKENTSHGYLINKKLQSFYFQERHS